MHIDPAPEFVSWKDKTTLKHLPVSAEIGRQTNINQLAERAIAELEDELFRQEPASGPVNPVGLVIATAHLSARIFHYGLSARELWTQRNHFNNKQIPLFNKNLFS